MAIGEIVVSLLAKTGTFDTDIQRSTKAAEKRMKELQKTVDSVASAVGASLVAAGAAAVYFGKEVIDGLDALNDVADATGASIENLSALEDVAVRTGASIDTVSSILVKFNNVLKEADGKNGVSMALEQIGLNAAELKSLDPAEALRQTAVALSQFADDGDKARVIQELFGKSVKDAAPFLKDLSEQTELLAKVTAAETEEAEKFNKSLFALQKNVIDVARDLAGPLVKSLNEVIQLFKDGRAAGKGFLEIGLDNYTKNVREFYGMKQPEQRGATGSWAEPVVELPKPSLRAPALPGANTADEIKAVTQAEKDRAKAIEDSAKKANQSFASYMDNLKRQLQQLDELSAAEKFQADLSEGRFKGLSARQITQLENTAKELDAKKAQMDADKAALDLTEKIIDANKRRADEGAAVYEATRTPMEQYLQRLERLNELLNAGSIDQDTFTRATKQAGDALVQAGEKADETGEKISTFAEEASRNIQDALGDTLEDALSGNFDNIGQMWLKLLQKMAAQALAAQLNEQLFGKSASGSGGGLGSALGSLFSAFTGSSAGSVGNAGYGDYKAYFDSLPKLAKGLDYVPYDEFPAVLHKGERVMTAADNRQFDNGATGQRSINVSSTVYVEAGVTQEQFQKSLDARDAKIKADLLRSRKQEYAR